jgi:CRISPR system Cascade subunit CasC
MAKSIKENLEDLAKKETKEIVLKSLAEALSKSVKSPDIALFGRMLEIEPSKPFGRLNLGITASSQVAHAISTHKVGLDFDYFTAVDDLLGSGEVGAGMLGTIEFNSACFYRYANINVDLLMKNLGNVSLAQKTVEAFIRSAIEAIPTGKQTWSATHEKPSLVFAVVRDAGMLSLANAFAIPVDSKEWNDSEKKYEEGLISNSIRRLSRHYNSVTGVYGDSAVSKVFVKTDAADAAKLGTDAGSFDVLIDKTMSAIFSRGGV